MFAVHGSVTGSFATRLPWIAERLGTDPGGLGLALLFAAVGSLSAMQFSGVISHRFPSRVVTPLLMVCWCLALILPALAPSVVLLGAAMVVYGATGGLADVAMNEQGVMVEQRLGKSIMSGLHGMWSIGVLLGSTVGILAAHADLDARVHFGIIALVLAVIAVAAGPRLLEMPDREVDEGPHFALPSKAVLLIAMIAFCAVFGELSGLDWAAIYLTNVTGANAGVAAAAVTGFSLTMALARLAGDRVVDRFGPVVTVRVAGVLAVAGALTVAVSRAPVPAIAGFALIGLGVAVIVPLAFTAAGNAGPRPAQQIAGVATIAYGAGLATPAAIGLIADVTSLPISFLVVASLTAFTVIGAGRLRRGSATPR
ncbi:MFS transporter [Acrocarpospora catenulata]|uniref:MFS transporter n=1 Tax=Acrocarpospora catenulata TaxID=2836182 RepID=UPI001BD98A7C|nr:MFS transporter [Acrocarpospora catenulata]